MIQASDTSNAIQSNQRLNNQTQAYLERLELSQAAIDFELVKRLQQRHMAEFSFNSLAVLTAESIGIDSQSVFQKIVEQGLGGYCFEHNKLIFDVLRDLGFDVSLQLARVVKADDFDVPRTHRFTLLNWQNKQYIVDGGYGPTAPLFPVEFVQDTVQHQGDQSYRIVKAQNGDFVLQRLNKGEFQPLYSFDLARYCESDALTGHFYSHKHPSAVFVNNLVVSRKDEEHIYSLRNHQLHIISGDETQIIIVEDKSMLQNLLLQHYGIDLDLAVVSFLFDRFVQPGLVANVSGGQS